MGDTKAREDRKNLKKQEKLRKARAFQKQAEPGVVKMIND